MNNNNTFTGKVALVTGGNSGIGLATAKRFVSEGRLDSRRHAFPRRSGHRPAHRCDDHVRPREHMTQREKLRSLYLSYLECCNEHDVDGMASFYTSTIKVNDVPMDPAAVAARFPPLFSAFPDWHWEIRHLVVDDDNIAAHFTVTGTHRDVFREIEATGRQVTTSEFTFYHIEDGKFAEVWDLTDMDAVMKKITL